MKKRCRPVALVTGASSGIGAEYTRRLAEKGYDLVLVARSTDRLESLAAEVKQAYGAETQVLPADLSLKSDVERVESVIRDTPRLRFLVNNAGFLTKGLFAETDLERQDAMIRVHVLAAVRLTRAAVPVMAASGKRCAVVNVSSIAAFGTSAENVTYCATKAYLNSFTHGLSVELEGTNIHVQALCPGYTHTELHDRADIERTSPESWTLTPAEVVTKSLQCLVCDSVVCIPRTRYKFAALLGTILPGRTAAPVETHCAGSALMRNIEIKARLSDLAAAEHIAAGADGKGTSRPVAADRHLLSCREQQVEAPGNIRHGKTVRNSSRTHGRTSPDQKPARIPSLR